MPASPPTRPIRRRVIAIVVAWCFVVGCGADQPPKAEEPGIDPARLAALRGAANNHDVLLVTLDTTRADHISCYGGADGVTPTIDGLAGHGLRFEHAITSVPLTLPSHATLMTGLYPPRHGVRNNGTYRLQSDRTTLAERLKAAGYSTAAFIGAFPLDRRFGIDQGFDFYSDRMPPKDLASALHYAERSAGAVIDDAMRWIARACAKKSRFFAWVHLFDPHAPYAPPSAEAARFPKAPYDGEIAYADAQLGRLLSLLKRRGRLRTTLVIVTADHGESLGEHGESTHGIFCYESTLHVPLVISDEDIVTEPIVISDRVAGLVDVVPTVLSMLGMEVKGDVDGVDLLQPPPDDRSIYFESLSPLLFHGWAPLFGLRTKSEKFVEAPEPEFYDIRADPDETSNRITRSRERAMTLSTRLKEMMSGWGTADEAAARQTIDPEVQRRLASIGYLRSRPVAPSGEARQDPKRMMPLWQRTERCYGLVQARRFSEALRELDVILKGDPNNAEAWYLRTTIHDAQGRLDLAEKDIRHAVALRPDAEGYAGLAEILYRLRRFDQGDEAVRTGLAIDEKSGVLHVARALGLALRGRKKEALRALDKAVEVDPGNAGAKARQRRAAIQRGTLDR